MKQLILAFLALFALPAAAHAQGFGGADRNFTVRQFEKVRIDGPVSVTLVTGVAPYARAKGDKGAQHNVEVRNNGDTLIVKWSQENRRGFRGDSAGPVTVEIGTRRVLQAWVNGSGTLDIDRVEGRTFDATVAGAGALRIASIEVDELDIGMSGSASAVLAGKAKDATLVVRGMSNLDAQSLDVRDLVLGVDGPSLARVHAEGQAEIDAIGPVDITVSGDPACTVRAQGPARILGCR